MNGYGAGAESSDSVVQGQTLSLSAGQVAVVFEVPSPLVEHCLPVLRIDRGCCDGCDGSGLTQGPLI